LATLYGNIAKKLKFTRLWTKVSSIRTKKYKNLIISNLNQKIYFKININKNVFIVENQIIKTHSVPIGASRRKKFALFPIFFVLLNHD